MTPHMQKNTIVATPTTNLTLQHLGMVTQLIDPIHATVSHSAGNFSGTA